MHLNAHTYYSLGYGTYSPRGLVEAAAQMGVKRLALTDINNTSAAFPFVRACREHGIEPVLGIEFRRDGKYLYTGIAQSTEGWANLCRFLSEHSLQDKPLPDVAPMLEDTFIIYRNTIKAPEQFQQHEYLGVRAVEVHRLSKSAWRDHQDRLIAFQPIVFQNEDGFRLHKLLRCIDQNIVIGKLEAKSCAREGDRFHPIAHLQKQWETAPGLLIRAEQLLERCSIELPSTRDNNRRYFTNSRSEDYQLLRKLAYSGALRRYDDSNTRAWARIEQELKVIDKMDFSAYFLITWDIVRYAQTSGYYHVGRGSGANSIVAYCLYLTDVDPLELDLYFERFINPHRTSPPDFDIDFSWDERDDVTDYVFKRYGSDYTALLATYSTYKGKSIVRELGKVLGLPKAEIDNIVLHPNDKGHHPYARHIMHFGEQLKGFPHHLSIHAGGILIGEKPLYYHTALQMMPKGFPITHFDMYTAEDMQFHKYDVLSQRGLGHIKTATALIRENQGKAVDVHQVQKIKEDPKVKAQLKSGHCIGCFYIESPAMRGLLSKLQCDNYVHLVAASSIIRPGVAKSGMMRAYIERSHDPDGYEYIHPVFEENLKETYGIMVYQEDVMKIVHHFAGLDLDESDVLRRIMTGKKKSGDQFNNLRDKYFRNCRKRGYPDELSQEVWRQIESFSGYSFCKAHSASFAVESFQSLYLKTYYPLEFMVGVINNFGGFYSTELYVHEARMLGGSIHPPCVNKSRLLTHLYDKDIYLGFIHLKSLEKRVAREIVRERERHGEYGSLTQFIRRVKSGKEQIQILVRIGAFAFTGKDKCALMWELQQAFSPVAVSVHQPELIHEPVQDYELPHLEENEFDQTFDEIELLGFPLRSPFDLLKEPVRGIVSREMGAHYGKVVEMTGYYVTRKHVTTVRKEHMNFGTWLDEEGRFFDTTHFPKELRRSPFKGKGCYRIKGKIVSDFGFYSMDVLEMEKLAWVGDKRYG